MFCKTLQNTTNHIILKAYNDDGYLLASLPYIIASNQTITLDSSEIIAILFSGTVIVTSSGTINALVELHRIRDDGVLAESIPAQTIAGSEFLFPHIASNEQWSTEIVLVNTSDNAKDLTLTAFDKDGNEIEGINSFQSINAHGRIYSKIRDIFTKTDGIAYIRSTSDSPSFVAHLIYYTNENSGHIMGGTIVKPLNEISTKINFLSN